MYDRITDRARKAIKLAENGAKMSAIDKAASKLSKSLRHLKWFHTVGIKKTNTEQSLVIYTRSNLPKNMKEEFAKSEWMGYKVEVKNIGEIRL